MSELLRFESTFFVRRRVCPVSPRGGFVGASSGALRDARAGAAADDDDDGGVHISIHLIIVYIYL